MSVFPSEIAGVGGSRRDLAALGRSIALSFADDVREELAKPEYRDRFFASMRAGLGTCDRTCMRLYAECHKLVGAQHDLAAAMLAALGATVEVARGAVDMRQRVESAGPAEVARAAFDALDRLCAERGLTYDELRASLSGAEVVETNGNGRHP